MISEALKKLINGSAFCRSVCVWPPIAPDQPSCHPRLSVTEVREWQRGSILGRMSFWLVPHHRRAQKCMGEKTSGKHEQNQRVVLHTSWCDLGQCMHRREDADSCIFEPASALFI